MALLNSVMAYRYLICSCCHKHVPQNNLWLKNSEITRIDFIIWLQPWEVMNHNLEMSPTYFSWPDPGRTSVIEKPRLRKCTLQWRYNERDGISNHRRIGCLLNRFLWLVSMKTSKLHVTRLCEGNSPVICEFPTQRASYAANVSIWWRHYDYLTYTVAYTVKLDPCRKSIYTCSFIWMLHNRIYDTALLYIGFMIFWINFVLIFYN